jgi:acyl-CoA synthetase (AMP-forming)/AMP-acid ligase II
VSPEPRPETPTADAVGPHGAAAATAPARASAPDLTTIPAVLAHRRRADPALRALVDDDGAVTYAELDDASAALAARLVATGVVKGDRVGLLAPNGVPWAVLACAAMRVGAVLVPFSTLLRSPELLAQLTTAQVTHLLAVPRVRGRDQLAELDAVAPGLVATVGGGGRHPALPSLRGVWRTNGLPGATASPDLVRAMEDRVRPADDMVVLFTSGSTGSPKGVIHTHGGGLRATAAGLDARRIGPGERLYIPMPLFWTGGFGGGLLSALVAGATLLTEAEPQPERTLRMLERERATLFRGWPEQAARLAAHPAFARVDLSSLGDGSLGALLPPERRPAPGSRPNLFGMTETLGPYCGDRLDVDLPPGKEGSCGRPFAGVEVRIADPESDEGLPAGCDGEILVRGPNVMRGLCGRPRSSTFTASGWYRTGDRGRLDAEGYLWYGGRLDDMFKVRGASVYPSEVEGALRAVDVVRQAHVTDVPDGDGRREVGALVVTDASLDDVVAAVRPRLSSFKVPTRWLLTAEAAAVPMTATGKVDKSAVRALLDGTAAADPRPPAAPPA